MIRASPQERADPGTAGEPKGVRLSHHNPVQNVIFTFKRFPAIRGDLALDVGIFTEALSDQGADSACTLFTSTSRGPTARKRVLEHHRARVDGGDNSVQ
jgi:hypothetical protein